MNEADLERVRRNGCVESAKITGDELDVQFSDNVQPDMFPVPLQGLDIEYLNWDSQIITFKLEDD